MNTHKVRRRRVEKIVENFPSHVKANLKTSKEVSSLISHSVIGDYPIDIEEFQNALEDDGVFDSFVSEKIEPGHFLDIGKMVYVDGYNATSEIKKIINHEMKSASEDHFCEAKALFDNLIFGVDDE